MDKRGQKHIQGMIGFFYVLSRIGWEDETIYDLGVLSFEKEIKKWNMEGKKEKERERKLSKIGKIGLFDQCL